MDVQTTRPHDEMFFEERADTFQLSVTLVGEQRLMITMKDFIDWIIYSKEYTEEDYCKEIHKKMEIVDVYTAFAQTQPQCDEESMRKKQTKGDQPKKYQFGTVVENVNDNLPCYKIERGGRITIYLSILDMRAKKQAIYESKLNLNKIRNMTEAEISKERSKIDKNQILEELSREIQKEKKEKEELLKRVIKLEEELRITKQELMEKDAEQDQKINQLSARNDEFNQRITLLELTLKSTKTELVMENQQIRQELNKTKEELAKALNSNKTEASTKIKQVQQQLEEKLQLQNPNSGLDKSEKMQEKSESIGDMTKLMTLPQAYSNQFKVDGYKIQCRADNYNYYHYILNSPIKHNKTATFKIKITKTQNSNIMVGVVDYAKQKDQRRSYNSGNAMCYGGLNGYKCPQKVKEGDGFRQGDVVEVDVDRATCTIKYIVNGVIKATHINQMLGDNSRVFTAYVEMIHIGDCVEWLL